MNQFDGIDAQIRHLQQQIDDTESHLQSLKSQLLRAQTSATITKKDRTNDSSKEAHKKDQNANEDATSIRTINKWPLEAQEYRRYGRQMILPQIGAAGQSALKNASVLIVGIGGLGCPAAAYLAGAGIGTIGLVDGDSVELSNLHRQILHSTSTIGISKVESAAQRLMAVNPLVKYRLHKENLSAENSLSLFKHYDIVLDCTDHPTSRYLISDTCVLANIPLVSASALKTEGQLIVLNNPPGHGPCYRCIFPKPPPAETIVSCGEGGILGPVVGTMGVLQALEAIKVLTTKPVVQDNTRATMLMFSAYGEPQFRTIKMRSRRADCASCSKTKTITQDSLASMDYATFCGVAPVIQFPTAHSLPVAHVRELTSLPTTRIVDVRDSTQYDICSLANSINIPWTGDVLNWRKKAASVQIQDDDKVLMICRHGNDSQLAALAFIDEKPQAKDAVFDARGGFQAWRTFVDPSWPDY